MAQVVLAEGTAGGLASALDHTGLCLLSLDGGGVRGLSTLHILKRLTNMLKYERQQMGAPALKPCELFDLIGGTILSGKLYDYLQEDESVRQTQRMIRFCKSGSSDTKHDAPFAAAVSPTPTSLPSSGRGMMKQAIRGPNFGGKLSDDHSLVAMT